MICLLLERGCIVITISGGSLFGFCFILELSLLETDSLLLWLLETDPLCLLLYLSSRDRG